MNLTALIGADIDTIGDVIIFEYWYFGMWIIHFIKLLIIQQ